MKIKVTTDTSLFKTDDVRVFYCDLIPTIAFRRVKWKLGYEYDLYLSWLSWSVALILERDKPIILAK
jgi:hypothetical protein